MEQWIERAEKAEAFKRWIHEYLDTHGVPHHPPGIHGEAGCRIGDRMDWLMAKVDALGADAERYKAALEMITRRYSPYGSHGGLVRLLQAVLAGADTRDRHTLEAITLGTWRPDPLDDDLGDLAVPDTDPVRYVPGIAARPAPDDSPLSCDPDDGRAE